MIERLIFLLLLIAGFSHAWQTTITKTHNVISCVLETPAAPMAVSDVITVDILTDTSSIPDNTHNFVITSTCSSLPLQFSSTISSSHKFTLTATAAVPAASSCVFTVTSLTPTTTPIIFSASTASEASSAASSSISITYADFPTTIGFVGYINTLRKASLAFPVFTDGMSLKLDLSAYYASVSATPAMRINATSVDCLDNDATVLAIVTCDDATHSLTITTTAAAYSRYLTPASTSDPYISSPSLLLTCQFPLALFPGDSAATITATYSPAPTPVPITHAITLAEVAVSTIQAVFTNMLQGDITAALLLRPFSQGEQLQFTTPQPIVALGTLPASCPVKDSPTQSSTTVVVTLTTDSPAQTTTVTITLGEPVLQGYIECSFPVAATTLTSDATTVQYISYTLNNGTPNANTFIFPPITQAYALALAIAPAGTNTDASTPSGALSYVYTATLIPVTAATPELTITSVLINAHITGDCAVAAGVDFPVIPATTKYHDNNRTLSVTIPAFNAAKDTLMVTATCPATASARNAAAGTVTASLYTGPEDALVFRADTSVIAPTIAYPNAQTQLVAELQITALRRMHFSSADITKIRDIISETAKIPNSDLFVSAHEYTSTYASQSSSTHTVLLAIASKSLYTDVLPLLATSKDAIAKELSLQYIIAATVSVDTRTIVKECVPAQDTIGVCGGPCALCLDGTLCLANDDCISGVCTSAAPSDPNVPAPGPADTFCRGANGAGAVQVGVAVLVTLMMGILLM